MKDFIEFIKSNPVFLIPVTVVIVLIVILILLILALSAQVKLEKASKKRKSADKQSNIKNQENSKETLDDSLKKEPTNTDFEPAQLQQEEHVIMQKEITSSNTLTETLNEPAALEQETLDEVPLITAVENTSSNLVEDKIKEEARTDITVSADESNINLI